MNPTTTAPALDPHAERLDRIEARLTHLLEHAERRDAELEPLRDLAAEVGLLAGPVMDAATERVADWEERGHLAFVRAGGAVVERIATGFDEADVLALGDNIVLILQTLRDLTQPEVLGLLRRTVDSVGQLDRPVHGPPPSTLALLRQLRDPEVRRGLERLLEVVRGVGAQSS